MLLSAGAQAQDARLQFLAKQLANAKDPRVRAQTAVILGGSGAIGAVEPLCWALADADILVRVAAINALGDLGFEEGRTCLRGVKDDNPQVKAALASALSSGKVVAGGIYLYIEPVADKAGGLPSTTLAMAEQLLRKHLSTMGGLAPAGETKAEAVNVIRTKQLRGFRIRPQLSLTATKGLKLDVLVMTYPDQALKGQFNVKASGAEHGALLKVMVPRVIEDAAEDLDWKTP